MRHRTGNKHHTSRVTISVTWDSKKKTLYMKENIPFMIWLKVGEVNFFLVFLCHGMQCGPKKLSHIGAKENITSRKAYLRFNHNCQICAIRIVYVPVNLVNKLSLVLSCEGIKVRYDRMPCQTRASLRLTLNIYCWSSLLSKYLDEHVRI